MHKEILTKEQIGLLPLVQSFSRDFGLVGGTAVALHIGHRNSVDFDLFTNKEFENANIRRTIARRHKNIGGVIRDEAGQYTVVVDGVRMTFFRYPFHLAFPKKFDGAARLPDLLTLAAMKAYALGRRSKWKDYVDLYFIIKQYRGLSRIAKKAKQMFAAEFNEKMFRAQLAYFRDIDYSEEVMYMKGFETDDGKVKKELVEFSVG